MDVIRGGLNQKGRAKAMICQFAHALRILPVHRSRRPRPKLALVLVVKPLLLFYSWKICSRIDGLIVDAHFVMEVRAGRSSSRANQSDSLTTGDGLAHAYIDL